MQGHPSLRSPSNHFQSRVNKCVKFIRWTLWNASSKALRPLKWWIHEKTLSRNNKWAILCLEDIWYGQFLRKFLSDVRSYIFYCMFFKCISRVPVQFRIHVWYEPVGLLYLFSPYLKSLSPMLHKPVRSAAAAITQNGCEETHRPHLKK